MIPFAVKIKGVTKDNQAQWVLAIDPIGERLLVVYEDASFHWHPMNDCTFVKLIPPDQPHQVIPVQIQKPLTVPSLAQRMRDNNGS